MDTLSLEQIQLLTLYWMIYIYLRKLDNYDSTLNYTELNDVRNKTIIIMGELDTGCSGLY